MNWITPAEELPDKKREIIVAWKDGQVTYLNYAHAVNWDYAKYWSYMPEHPDTVVAQNSTSNNNAMDAILALKKNGISGQDMHDVGWNGAINTVVNVLKQHQ